MSNWISISKSTLHEAGLAALIDACDSVALGEAQPPRAPGLIQGVVTEIRAAVQGCPARRIDSDATTIPASLRDLAVDLIIARLKGAIQQELTRDEADTVAWRRRTLTEIRDCAYPIEQPDTATAPEVQTGASAEVLHQTRTQITGDSLKGL